MHGKSNPVNAARGGRQRQEVFSHNAWAACVRCGNSHYETRIAHHLTDIIKMIANQAESDPFALLRPLTPAPIKRANFAA
jgi:hypothetical protein